MGQVNPGSLPPDSPDMIRRQDLATQAQANIVLLASLTDHAGAFVSAMRVRCGSSLVFLGTPPFFPDTIFTAPVSRICMCVKLPSNLE